MIGSRWDDQKACKVSLTLISVSLMGAMVNSIGCCLSTCCVRLEGLLDVVGVEVKEKEA